MRIASTLAAAAVAGLGVLAAQGTASADVYDTIRYWEQQGYQVNIDRVGSGPMDKCVVTSVRNPNTITRLVRVGGRNDTPTTLVPVIVSRTVQLSLYCAN
jgi:hypothetical protein